MVECAVSSTPGGVEHTMEIHHEELAEIRRYIENQKGYGLQGKAAQYERYLRLIRKARKVDSSTRMLEVGTGTGWFPLLCKADGLRCKGLEISPQRIEVAMELGAANGIEADIELGNVEDTDIGTEEHDAIVASSVFEHVEKWYDGLTRVYRALRPGGVLFFESSNKFSLKPTECPVPFYGWLPDRLRYRLRIMVQGPEIMKLGIDFNQFRYAQLRRALREIGFQTILDAVDLSELGRLRGLKKAMMETAKRNGLARSILPTFMDATTLVCIK
jgi:ubiquinone/menaquinone biosynthesis C-methylase UbiE